MNQERLREIYSNIAIADKSDMDHIRQMTVDFPYYAMPYVVLSKHYYQTGHYKFEDILRQAALRVRDRKALYDYIHDTGSFSTEPEPEAGLAKQEEVVSVEDFLRDEEPEITTDLEELMNQPVLHEKHSLEPETEIEAPELKEESEVVPSPETQSTHFQEEEEVIIEEPAFRFNETESVPDQVEASSFTSSEEPVAEQEFRLDGKIEILEDDGSDKTFDIIGEEIETEFSFTHSFVQESEEEKNTSLDELIDKNLGEELRKYPVYNLETFYHETGGQAEEKHHQELSGAEDEQSPEKDFFAWLNSPHNKEKKGLPAVVEAEEEDSGDTANSNVNLDLIDRFIKSNPQITRPKKEFFNAENMAKRSELNDLEIVTETLANIYYEQGNYDLAIRSYEKLSLQNPLKEAYFASLIEKIKKERK